MIAYDRCPLCLAQDFHVYREDKKHDERLTWLRCSACKHVFRDGYHTDEERDELFRTTNIKQTVAHQFEGNRFASAKVVDKVCQFVHFNWEQGRAWFDVGFGNGSLLFTAQEYGFLPVGIDLRKTNVERMQKIGVEAHCCEVQYMPSRRKYAVISLADVLEHMPYPRKTMAVLPKLLADDGCLFISTPNMDNIHWSLLDERGNPYWRELEHYHVFRRESIFTLLREYGFEPVDFGVSERYRLCMEVIAKRS